MAHLANERNKHIPWLHPSNDSLLGTQRFVLGNVATLGKRNPILQQGAERLRLKKTQRQWEPPIMVSIWRILLPCNQKNLRITFNYNMFNLRKYTEYKIICNLKLKESDPG